MELSLNEEQESMVEAQLSTGLYRDASDVIASALETLEERMVLESGELEAALLEGVKDDHVSYGPETLYRVRKAAQQGR